MTHERTTIDPDVMFGKPVIKGTRIPVEQILRKLGGGAACGVDPGGPFSSDGGGHLCGGPLCGGLHGRRNRRAGG